MNYLKMEVKPYPKIMCILEIDSIQHTCCFRNHKGIITAESHFYASVQDQKEWTVKFKCFPVKQAIKRQTIIFYMM